MIRKLLLVICVQFMLALPSYSFAEFRTLTGGELLDDCQAAIDIFDKNSGYIQSVDSYTEGVKAGTCEGYLMSLNDLNNLKTHDLDYQKKLPKIRKYYCLPNNYGLLQAAAFVVKYLNDHPKEKNKPASLLALNGYQKYFGCWD